MSAARCRRSSKDRPVNPQAYGDTKTQTVGVNQPHQGILEGQGGMGDVVKVQVFWSTTAAPMDFKAFGGYTQFFGGSQPNLPARSVVGVAPHLIRLPGRDRGDRGQETK